MVAILTSNVEVVAGDASHFNLPQVVLHTKLCEEGQRFEKRTVRRKTHILAIRDVPGTEETPFCLLSPAELTCLIPAADVLTGFEFVQASPLHRESPLSPPLPGVHPLFLLCLPFASDHCSDASV